jgi:transcriptional regulator with XRE-family HTH domain
MPTVKCELRRIWNEKEIRENRRITIEEVATATQRSRDAISGLLNGTTERWDASLIADVASFFGVKSGTPVPFLIYYQD